MVNLIFDNGAGKLKFGVAGDASPRGIVTNASAKVNKSMQYLTADQIDAFNNGSLLQFNRPFDRGYLNNWQSEIEVWSRVLSTHLQTKPSEDTLTLTEPLFNPETIRNDTNEVVFEYFGFRSHFRRPAASFSALEFLSSSGSKSSSLSSCMVIDCGFSYSHAVPFVNGICQKSAVKRVNIGGKLLTNYLKEVVSYRQWNMMDEFALMDQVKEQLCFLSADFAADIKLARLPVCATDRSSRMRDPWGGRLKKSFVLPDFKDTHRGYPLADDAQPKQDEQVLAMETERFCVPELLFHPSDIGIDQAGIAEASWQSLQCLDFVEMGLAASGVVLTGGSTRFPRFRERFESEFRQLVPDLFPVEVYQPDAPELYAWRGASRFVAGEAGRGALEESMVSRADYLEFGHHHCNERFSRGW